MRYIFKDSLLFRLCFLSVSAEGQSISNPGGRVLEGAKQVPELRDAGALTTAPWCGIRRGEE